MKRGLIFVFSLLFLSGCANIPQAWQTQIVLPISERAALAEATRISSLPRNKQEAACIKARAQLQNSGVKRVQARLDLAALALAVPHCLPPGTANALLQDLPKNTLLDFMRVLAKRQMEEAEATQQMQGQINRLQSKLDALTRIEQQINQVKDRELHFPTQSKNSSR